ncbi:hypothetical protein BCR34DRAFT_588971 [Clohesyomyces aquaticus]|uniref:Uncharacterized protein n=1 Tax=Clohesyomyces aquaticus TaxID=1231657 RepID=A0A1Y1ZI20_9PLEO|nr:hypothetical protein BCR34DRAFT_588971 [Clohesyomyces aquaticus]
MLPRGFRESRRLPLSRAGSDVAVRRVADTSRVLGPRGSLLECWDVAKETQPALHEHARRRGRHAIGGSGEDAHMSNGPTDPARWERRCRDAVCLASEVSPTGVLLQLVTPVGARDSEVLETPVPIDKLQGGPETGRPGGAVLGGALGYDLQNLVISLHPLCRPGPLPIAHHVVDEYNTIKLTVSGGRADRKCPGSSGRESHLIPNSGGFFVGNDLDNGDKNCGPNDCSQAVQSMEVCADPSWVYFASSTSPSSWNTVCCLPGWQGVTGSGGGGKPYCKPGSADATDYRPANTPSKGPGPSHTANEPPQTANGRTQTTNDPPHTTNVQAKTEFSSAVHLSTAAPAASVPSKFDTGGDIKNNQNKGDIQDNSLPAYHKFLESTVTQVPLRKAQGQQERLIPRLLL